MYLGCRFLPVRVRGTFSYPTGKKWITSFSMYLSTVKVGSRRGFPAPEEPEALSMPADQGVWLHNGQRLTPVEPTAQPDQGEAGAVGNTARFDMALLVEGKLLT